MRAQANPARQTGSLRGALRALGLLGAAFFWVIRVRWGLWFGSLTDLQTRYTQQLRSDTPSIGAKRIPQAVRLAAAFVPGASCLTQALAAQILFARRGISSVLHIGVENAQGFKAHAWLEIEDQPILGGTVESLAKYSRIAAHPCPPPISGH